MDSPIVLPCISVEQCDAGRAPLLPGPFELPFAASSIPATAARIIGRILRPAALLFFSFFPAGLGAIPPDSGLDFFQLQQVFQVPSENLSTERSREIQGMWAYPENIQDRFDEIIGQDRDWSNAYFRRAMSIYERTVEQDREFLKKQKDVYRTLKENDDPRPMSAREKRDALRNSFAHERIRHHEKMAWSYNEVLKLLDSGKAGPVETGGEKLKLYLECLRMSVIHFSKGRRYSEALWRLRRYFQLNADASREWPFHFYVAISLSHLHRRSEARGASAESLKLQSLRDRYTLNYLELRYGRDSYQYTQTFQKLRREAGPLHFLKDPSNR